MRSFNERPAQVFVAALPVADALGLPFDSRRLSTMRA